MVIDPDIISSPSKKLSRADRYIPRWAIYSSAGVGVFVFVVLIKAIFPLMGMTLLLVYIWSQSTTNRRYLSYGALIIKAFLQMTFEFLSSYDEMVNRGHCSIENINYKD